MYSITNVNANTTDDLVPPAGSTAAFDRDVIGFIDSPHVQSQDTYNTTDSFDCSFVQPWNAHSDYQFYDNGPSSTFPSITGPTAWNSFIPSNEFEIGPHQGSSISISDEVEPVYNNSTLISNWYDEHQQSFGMHQNDGQGQDMINQCGPSESEFRHTDSNIVDRSKDMDSAHTEESDGGSAKKTLFVEKVDVLQSNGFGEISTAFGLTKNELMAGINLILNEKKHPGYVGRHLGRPPRSSNQHWPCRYCADMYYSRGGRLLHEKMVHGTHSRFACTLCYMKYGRKKRLENHIKLAHLGEGNTIEPDIAAIAAIEGLHEDLNLRNINHRVEGCPCVMCTVNVMNI